MGKGKPTKTRTSSTIKKLNTPTPGRPKPMTPKAGVTLQRRRYSDGGNLCW